MKIRVTTSKASNLQKLFSAPLDLEQRVEKIQLLVMEKLLHCMEKIGINQSDLADKMGISNARVSKMLGGTNNFTLVSLVKAAEAVDCELSINFKPKGHEEIWTSYEKGQVHSKFRPDTNEMAMSQGQFVTEGLDLNEVPCYAA